MGQKVNPISMRLQANKDWRSKWFVGKNQYAKYLADDLKVRKLIQDKFGSRGAINKVDIERSPNLITVTIATAKAGVVIGRGGQGAQELKAALEKVYGVPVRVNIEEVKKPDLYAGRREHRPPDRAPHELPPCYQERQCSYYARRCQRYPHRSFRPSERR